MRAWVAAAVVLGLAGAASAQSDTARAQKIIGGSCFLCHRADGESASEVFPRLAGQNAEYIAKQLDNFKSGQRQSAAMAPVVAELSREDMAALGHFYASRPPHRQAARDAALAAAGQALYHQGKPVSGVPACASCHGADAAGSQTLPRLAGQHAAYLVNQLRQFGQRQRGNDNAVMHAIASQMSAQDMAAVAEYLSGK